MLLYLLTMVESLTAMLMPVRGAIHPVTCDNDCGEEEIERYQIQVIVRVHHHPRHAYDHDYRRC